MHKLEALLPPFVDLPTAIAASCRAMNAAYTLCDESILCESLGEALKAAVSDEDDALQVLQNIRTWALDYLLD